MSLIVGSTDKLKDWNDSECSAKAYPYPLDNFQQRAIRAINKGENVFCLAMTGSGKTLLADYGIAYSLQIGKRVIFTSPIKALSNQKYKEFKDVYGAENVGIMTGDIKFNPDASILIMTAEILCNLLYKSHSYTKDLGISSRLSLEDVYMVIMDEVHYINNKERGHVWEETLIMLPKDIRLVLLSATLDNPERLGNWLARIRGIDIHMLTNTIRVVPLTYYLYKPTAYSDLATPKLRDAALVEIMNNAGTFAGTRVYQDWCREFNRMIDYTLPSDSDEYKRQADRTFTGHYRLNNLIEYLKYCGLCPAICFTFSRRNCELYAKSIQDSLITGKESAEIEHIFKFYTHHYETTLRTLPQYYLLLDVLKKGVAFHHSGLVPILKETVEIIFSKGLIKVLFATETFSVGLNMPTKTVVFLELSKPDSESGTRLLLTDEFLQMAGRAGRRGKDTRGYVIYCPMRQPEVADRFKGLLTGKKSPVESKMDFGFQFIIKSLHSGIYKWSEILTNSFWYVDQLAHRDHLTTQIATLTKKIEDTQFTDREIERLDQRHTLEHNFKNSTPANKRQCQRELEQWKNTNIGKRWDDLYARYRELDTLKDDLAYYKEELAAFGNLNLFMDSYARYLARIGYLDNLPDDLTTLSASNLTERGIVATEINEGHTISGVELYYYLVENMKDTISICDILKYLSIFISDDRNINSDSASSGGGPDSVVKYIQDKANEYGQLADTMGIVLEHTYWDINTCWCGIVEDWVSDIKIGEIMSKYEIMEGNLTRGILKLMNLVEEWRNIATYLNNTKMLELLGDAEQLLIKDVVLQDSLYIRIT